MQWLNLTSVRFAATSPKLFTSQKRGDTPHFVCSTENWENETKAIWHSTNTYQIVSSSMASSPPVEPHLLYDKIPLLFHSNIKAITPYIHERAFCDISETVMWRTEAPLVSIAAQNYSFAYLRLVTTRFNTLTNWNNKVSTAHGILDSFKSHHEENCPQLGRHPQYQPTILYHTELYSSMQ